MQVNQKSNDFLRQSQIWNETPTVTINYKSSLKLRSRLGWRLVENWGEDWNAMNTYTTYTYASYWVKQNCNHFWRQSKIEFVNATVTIIYRSLNFISGNAFRSVTTRTFLVFSLFYSFINIQCIYICDILINSLLAVDDYPWLVSAEIIWVHFNMNVLSDCVFVYDIIIDARNVIFYNCFISSGGFSVLSVLAVAFRDVSIISVRIPHCCNAGMICNSPEMFTSSPEVLVMNLYGLWECVALTWS